ncbi:hypothetical protein RhiirA1_504021 [Rhizophagus irregularis]|uniref:Uncharacterized protein n=1 Tax=Rhizophagus irregularis TaxID=588596 RepID=A0A2N0QW85_9GLOM|nr:hypothetical protein RhiirA1_504021 [Rhizophagus irregularis]
MSKILFENFVYPSQDEYKLATEKYLKDKNLEFICQFKKNQWIIFFKKKIALILENRDKFTHSDNDSHDGNDVDDSGDRAADDEAGAADDGVTNNGRPNDDAANDGIADDDILSSDSYNTEEDGQYVNSLIENYELRKK